MNEIVLILMVLRKQNVKNNRFCKILFVKIFFNHEETRRCWLEHILHLSHLLVFIHNTIELQKRIFTFSSEHETCVHDAHEQLINLPYGNLLDELKIARM